MQTWWILLFGELKGRGPYTETIRALGIRVALQHGPQSPTVVAFLGGTGEGRCTLSCFYAPALLRRAASLRCLMSWSLEVSVGGRACEHPARLPGSRGSP